VASDGSSNPLDPSPPARKSFRFGLRSVLLVTTIVAVVAGLYFARKQRHAVAFLRFETTWARLEKLVQTPVEGFVARGPVARSVPSFGAGDSAAAVQWRFTLKTTPETANRDAAALLRLLRVHFGTALIELGLENHSSLDNGKPLSDESMFQDEIGESAVLLRIDFDDRQTQAEISLLWLHHMRAGAW
jgi:hypothetical protein